MKKLLILVSIVFLLWGPGVLTIQAKRLLPQLQNPVATGQKSGSAKTQGIPITVKFRSDRRAILADFRNLENAQKVEYTLTYTTEGIEQGVVGTINPTTNEEKRELLFGTCSKNVCRYHTGISGAKFIVTTTLKNGRKVVKPFRLRV